MKLVHWPLMGGLLHLVQRGVLAVQPTHHCNGHLPITVLMYNGPLLCGINVTLVSPLYVCDITCDKAPATVRCDAIMIRVWCEYDQTTICRRTRRVSAFYRTCDHDVIRHVGYVLWVAQHLGALFSTARNLWELGEILNSKHDESTC